MSDAAATLSSLALLSSHADEHVRLIATEAARVIREREWRDIASAPRNTYVLIELAGSYIPDVGIVSDDGIGAWINGEYWSTATKWQPLPAPAEG
jgi:hypothetical protein